MHPSLTSTLDTAMQRIFNHYVRIRHEIANKTNLNTTELEFLSALLLAGRQMSVKEVSGELHLCSQAITKTSKHLMELGLVKIQKSLEDKRITFISLTEAGHKLASVEKSLREVLLLRSLQAYSNGKIDEFQQTLLAVQVSMAGIVSGVVEQKIKELTFSVIHLVPQAEVQKELVNLAVG